MNHSDEPSCYQDFELGRDVALRPIREGEPITIDATDESRHELATFLTAYLDAQQRRDVDGLRRLLSADAVWWEHGRVVRGADEVSLALAGRPALSLDNVEWQLGTGRWEALCSAEPVGDSTSDHVTLFLRVVDGNWQVTYHHRG